MSEPDVAPVAAYVERLWELGASDLLLTAESPPLVRVDGQLRPIEGEPVLGRDDTERVVRQLLGPDLFATLQADREVDFSFGWLDQARLRANAFHQRGAISLALRIIPFEIPSF